MTRSGKAKKPVNPIVRSQATKRDGTLLADDTSRELSTEERKAALLLEKRMAKKQQSPRLKLEKKKCGSVKVATDHENEAAGITMLMNAVGTTDTAFLRELMSQLVNAGIQNQNFEGQGPNFMLSVVKATEPKDEIEAMLAAQMAAVHMATK